MLPNDAFRDQPVLHGASVRLEPLTAAVLGDYLPALADPDVVRLTGSHASSTRDAVAAWLHTRAGRHDRADWAIVRAADGAFLGEAVLNEFQPADESANYRVWLARASLFGHGYGSEATRLVLGYAFNQVGLHRVSLQVYDHNPRARRAYEKCGFIVEGRLRHALLWEGHRHDALVMSVLSTDPRTGP